MVLTRSIHTIAACAAAMAFAVSAQAGEPTKLSKEELEKVLTGKTINYTNVNGSSAIVTFEADGRATYKGGGNSKASIGTWQAGDDGRYCIKITSGKADDHCRRVLKTDTGYSLRTGNGELLPVSGLE